MDRERTFNAFRICITDRKCENTDCPYEYECEKVNNGQIQIPKVLALDVMKLLKEQSRKQVLSFGDGYAEGYKAKDQEIVRCKDCAYALFKEGVQQGHIVCTKPFTERWQSIRPNNWYCADGKRRTD